MNNSANTSAGTSGVALNAAAFLKQFSKFTLVGAVATSGHFLVLICLVQLFRINPIVASACGFVCGALIGYGLNYSVTFRSHKRHSEAAPKFVLVAISGLSVNTSIMYGLISWLDAHYLASQIVATGIVLVWNFSLNRWWTFRGDGSA